MVMVIESERKCVKCDLRDLTTTHSKMGQCRGHTKNTPRSQNERKKR